MDISRNVSRAAQALGITGYTNKIMKCWCGVTTNVIWQCKLVDDETVACTYEHANQLPVKCKKGTTSNGQA